MFDDKYSLRNSENLWQPIQNQLSKKQLTFSEFFVSFLKSKSNFENFEKKMTPIAYVFPKNGPPKTLLDKCLKRPVSEHRLTASFRTI